MAGRAPRWRYDRAHERFQETPRRGALDRDGVAIVRFRARGRGGCSTGYDTQCLGSGRGTGSCADHDSEWRSEIGAAREPFAAFAPGDCKGEYLKFIWVAVFLFLGRAGNRPVRIRDISKHKEN